MKQKPVAFGQQPNTQGAGAMEYVHNYPETFCDGSNSPNRSVGNCMQPVSGIQSPEPSEDDDVNRSYCKLIDEVFEEAWTVNLGADKVKCVCLAGGENDDCVAGVDIGKGDPSSNDSSVGESNDELEDTRGVSLASNTPVDSPTLPTMVDGSMASSSTLAIFLRAASHVLQSLTSVETKDMESNHYDPLGLGAYRNCKEVEDLGSTTGKGAIENIGSTQAMVEAPENEYMTENEDVRDDMIVPHEFSTLDRETRLVNYEDSPEDYSLLPSQDSVGLAIEEVEREGWNSNGTPVPNIRHLPTQVPLILLLISFRILLSIIFAHIYLLHI